MSYKPATATDALRFDNEWCNRCKRDAGFRANVKGDKGCSFPFVRLCGKFINSEFPPQWKIGEDGKPYCEEFQKR